VTESSKAVFLSYASQDAETAQRLCNALRVAGIEVWFDQSELRGGDAWDASIRRQIKNCALFIPVISKNTHTRGEGYFRLEWKLAVDRSHLMASDLPFLLPVVVDDTPDEEDRVPDRFREVQWTRLPAGANADTFIEHVRRLLAPDAATPAATSVRSPALPPLSIGAASIRSNPPTSRSFVPWIAGGLLILGTGYLLADKFLASTHVTEEKPAVVAATTATSAIPAIAEKSVAVLPFLDMSEKKDQEYFSDGLSEELIDLLTKVPELRVPARTSSFYFKGKSEDIPTIAKRLLVAHVLEGSVRKSGNRIRVTAQLIRADNGYHLWSETYDRKFDDIFKIQDEIAGAVVKALKVSLLDTETTRIAPTANTEAYTLYVQARALTLHGTPADAAKAADYLQRAIQLDPKFAPAYARLTQTLTFQYEIGTLPFEQARDAARKSAQQALKLDPTLAAAHLSMARVHAWFNWDWDAEGAEIARAIQLDPGDADAVRWAGVHALTLGRLDEAIGLFQRAVDLDPLNAANRSVLCGAETSDGRLAPAELACRRAIELAPPDGFGSRNGLAVIMLASGQPAAALASFEQLDNEEDRDGGKAVAYFALGRKTDSDAALADLEKRFAKNDAYGIAEIHAYRGEDDQALDWLNRAYLLHASELSSLKGDWFFIKLRSNARFKALLHKMNLPD